MNSSKELSIVIATLNEEAAISALLSSITTQEEVDFEVIVADGASTDRTIAVVHEVMPDASIISAKRGRASQLNAGAALANSEFILFLHADSIISDSLALRRSLDFLKENSQHNNGKPYAGHFSVRFRCGYGGTSLAYRVLEAKAAMNRRGCSHGDQGILCPAELFMSHPGFDESCQILAETRLADRFLENGLWLLLPAELSTSARRFEKEGLFERQSLNAVIMVLGAAGFDNFLNDSLLYSENGRASKLHLGDALQKTATMIASLGKVKEEQFWSFTGEYICENVWQLPLWAAVFIDRRSDYRKHGFLKLYDRYFRGIAESRTAARLAGRAARLWLKVLTYKKRSTRALQA
ncbi:MAG: glycosyltransferase [Geobacteraceae bacterium]|nr:glycosyltransferase [Geobacteraceae bacterium]